MILVTGATGNVGRAAVTTLLERKVPFRVLVRDAAKLADSVRREADIAVANLQNVDAVRQALRGVTSALLVTPNRDGQVEIESSFVDAAAELGVQHLVKISSMEAAADAKSEIPKSHFRVEERIRASGMRWTFLRPNFYMQNLLMQTAQIRDAGRFTLPLGDAKTALIDARDVGHAAAEALLDNRHANECYELTGPQILSFDEVAAALSAKSGRTIRYERQSLDDFRTTLSHVIPSSRQVEALVALFAQIAGGALARSSDDYRTITGREARSIESFAVKFAQRFVS